MTLSNAAAYAQLQAAKDAIIDSDRLPLLDKLRHLSTINRIAAEREPPKGSILAPILGAALGLGLAHGVGSMMGLSDATQAKVNLAGLAFGGLMGLQKNADDRRNAFRLGFLRAAKEAGYFEKVAFNPVGLVVDPVVGAGSAARAVGDVAGSAIGAFDAYDDTDEDIMKMQVEKELLKQQLSRLQAEKRNQIVRAILDRRRRTS